MEANPYAAPQACIERGMKDTANTRRWPLTVVETLVAIAICGILAALFLPAVESKCRPRSIAPTASAPISPLPTP